MPTSRFPVRLAATQHYWKDEPLWNAKRTAYLEKIPLEGAGECAEIAEVAAFLAVNGTDVLVDGGLFSVNYGAGAELWGLFGASRS
jgi:hypothetical protein